MLAYLETNQARPLTHEEGVDLWATMPNSIRTGARNWDLCVPPPSHGNGYKRCQGWADIGEHCPCLATIGNRNDPPDICAGCWLDMK